MVPPSSLRPPPAEGVAATAGQSRLRARPWWLRWLVLPLAAGALLLVLLLGGGGSWLLATDAGTQWLLQRLPMVKVQGFKGRALGGRWAADSLRVEWDAGRQWLLVEGLAADGLQWHWRPNPHAWLALRAGDVTARKVTLDTGPPSGKPPALPESIAIPLQLSLGKVQVATLQVNTLEPLAGLLLENLVLDAEPGAEHRVDRLAVQAFGMQVDGALRIGNRTPLPLQAEARVQPVGEAPRWTAALQARGNAQALQLSGTLRGSTALKAGEQPSVDLQADVRPLAPWPLAALRFETRSLDLSALASTAPVTRLSGSARIEGGEGASPLAVRVELTNALPGRIDENRLPATALLLEASGTLQRRERIDFRRFELQLADARQRAGRLSGSAVWNADTLELTSQLDNVAPQRLDKRAAAMTLSGPVSATLGGLPSPAGATAAAPGASAAATTTGAPNVPNMPTSARPLQATFQLDLQGRLDAVPQAVALQAAGNASAERFELTRLQARSGTATADLTARGVRAGAGWRLASRGSINQFDPLPWWPGEGAWAQGPHRLTAQWDIDASLPANAAQLGALALAQRTAGNGSLRIGQSQIAGVPLAADITLAQPAAATLASLQADVTLGGNRLQLQGRAEPAGNGANDRVRAELDAPALAALAPVIRLVPALAAWLPQAGSAEASVQAAGRWPQLTSEGTARVSQLQAGKLKLQQARASWNVAMAGTQALQLQAEANGIAFDQQRIDALQADIRGTLAEHRIDASASLPLAPPAAAAMLFGLTPATANPGSTRAALLARGSWQPASAGGGRWRGLVERAAVGGWPANGQPPAGTTAWAEVLGARGELAFDGGGQLRTLQAEAGRLRLGDSLALRWDAAQVDLRGAQPRVQLSAELEPFAVAPLLARVQPGMKWAGDLKLAARLDIRAADRLDADIVFERREGDLQVLRGEGAQQLGLTDLRVALNVHDGVWQLTPQLRGRSVGSVTGRVVARTTPDSRWPQPDAPLEGSLQAQVGDIGIWSAWVPPGWRLAGAIDGTASVGGRFGAPQLTGEIRGSNLGARNLLQGVNVSDGQVAIRLQGEQAQIERFALRGGDGLLTVAGGFTFGARPQAQLQFTAERFRVLGRVDRSIVASGTAELQLGGASGDSSGRLDGKFVVDQGLIDANASGAPGLDDDVVVRRVGDKPPEAAFTAPPPRRNFALNVELDLGQDLRVRGRGLDAGLRGVLRVTAPAGRLAINGTVSTDNGTYKAYGQNLAIERGLIVFTGVVENPRLDVLALRANLDQRVGVAITGTATTPRVRLFSEPEMSDTDKLSWLILGRAPDGLGKSDTAMLQRAAVALLSGEGESPTDGLFKRIGIDDISLRQSEGEVRDTIVSIGKQISQRWYLGYERGMQSTTGTFQLIYRIAQRFTLRAQGGQDNSLDVIWTWRLREAATDAAASKTVVRPPR